MIEPRHLSNLKSLFRFWSNSSMDEGITTLLQIPQSEYERSPIVDLLRHIHPHRNKFTAEQFIVAAELNGIEFDNAMKKIHPTVYGKTTVDYGPKSTIYGSITPPSKLIRGVHAGSHGMMWVTMTLLDNGKWIKHHIPFHNSRYYEEMYAYREGLPVGDKPRRPVLGNRVGNHIDNTGLINKKCRKASKAYLRTIQNMNHNVWFDPDTHFLVQRNGDNFAIQISSRIKESKPKSNVEVGDRILGMDQNQTASNTYSVVEVVREGTENSHPYNNYFVKVIEDGNVTSCTTKNDRGEFDQLSYEGLAYSEFEIWRQARIAFLSAHDPELAQKMIDKTNESLYKWNNNYAYFLKVCMRNKMNGDNHALFRNEIKEFIEGMPVAGKNEKHKFFGSIRGSLSLESLEGLSKSRSLISCYFYLLEKKEIEQQKEFDSDLFKLGECLSEKRVNKREERANRIVSSVLQICSRLNVSRIVIENKLPTANHENKSSANRRATDWCPRKVQQKLLDAVKMVGIKVLAVKPYNTSHIDPFVNGESNRQALEARFMDVDVKDITDRNIKQFKKMHRNQVGVLNSIYHNALRSFAANYGLNWNELPNMNLEQIKNALKDHVRVMFPQWGGRSFMSTHNVTRNSVRVSYNNRTRWLNFSDVIAALNIALRGSGNYEPKGDSQNTAPSRNS